LSRRSLGSDAGCEKMRRNAVRGLSCASWPRRPAHRRPRPPQRQPALKRCLQSGTWGKVRTIQSFSSVSRHAPESECLCGCGFV
jgi:hypothetical protein